MLVQPQGPMGTLDVLSPKCKAKIFGESAPGTPEALCTAALRQDNNLAGGSCSAVLGMHPGHLLSTELLPATSDHCGMLSCSSPTLTFLPTLLQDTLRRGMDTCPVTNPAQRGQAALCTQLLATPHSLHPPCSSSSSTARLPLGCSWEHTSAHSTLHLPNSHRV